MNPISSADAAANLKKFGTDDPNRPILLSPRDRVMGEEQNAAGEFGKPNMPAQAPQYTGADKPDEAGAFRRTMGMNLMAAGAGFGQGMMGQRVGRAFSQAQGGMKDLMGQRNDQVGLQRLAQGQGQKQGGMENIMKMIANFKAKFGGGGAADGATPPPAAPAQ